MTIKRETVEERKALPIATGVLDYFPDALLAVAEVSRIGNEQHHPGEPLHWDKSKSTDQADALMRHLLDRGTMDTDGVRHSAKVAWRALALLQTELDAEAVFTGVDLAAEGTIDRSKFFPYTHQDYPSEWDQWGPKPGRVDVTYRGEWPPDTRVGGLLTCCGQREHSIDCPQWR